MCEEVEKWKSFVVLLDLFIICNKYIWCLMVANIIIMLSNDTDMLLNKMVAGLHRIINVKSKSNYLTLRPEHMKGTLAKTAASSSYDVWVSIFGWATWLSKKLKSTASNHIRLCGSTPDYAFMRSLCVSETLPWVLSSDETW